MDGLQNNYQVAPTQQVNFQGNSYQTEPDIQTKPQQIKDGDSKLKNALIGLGVAAAAGVVLYKTGAINKAKNFFTKNSTKVNKELTEKINTADQNTLEKIFKASDDGIANMNKRLGDKQKHLAELQDLKKAAQEGSEEFGKLSKEITETQTSIKKIEDSIQRNINTKRQIVEKAQIKTNVMQDFVHTDGDMQKTLKEGQELLASKKKLLSSADEADKEAINKEIEQIEGYIKKATLGNSDSSSSLQKLVNTAKNSQITENLQKALKKTDDEIVKLQNAYGKAELGSETAKKYLEQLTVKRNLKNQIQKRLAN